jgi:tRNA (adenine57-N1/adenine58-N1)-methyltransferase
VPAAAEPADTGSTDTGTADSGTPDSGTAETGSAPTGTAGTEPATWVPPAPRRAVPRGRPGAAHRPQGGAATPSSSRPAGRTTPTAARSTTTTSSARPRAGSCTPAANTPYLTMRPRLADYVLSMPRGAQVIYPKDSAQILMWGDVFPGARVLEGRRRVRRADPARCCRPSGPTGKVVSYEVRDDHAPHAVTNVETFFGHRPPHWELTVGDVRQHRGEVDRVVLDMLSAVGRARHRPRLPGAGRDPRRLRRDHHPAVGAHRGAAGDAVLDRARVLGGDGPPLARGGSGPSVRSIG